MLDQALALSFAKFEMLPRAWHIRGFKVVDRELLLVGQAHVSVLHFPAGVRIARPDDVVDGIDVLEKGAQAFESVGQFGRDGIEIHAPALLEVGELCDFEAIEHDLPSDAPRAERRRFPVIFFKLDVVLPQVNADRAQRFEIKFLNVFGRRLQDDLELHVLEQAVRIFSVTAVGGPARGLHICDLVGLRTEHAKESFWSHRAGAYFHIVGLLDDRAARSLESLELEDELLEGQRIGFG